MDDTQRRAIATHEGAHAVVGHEKGGHILRITIASPYTESVQLWTNGSSRPDSRARWEMESILSGNIAELIFLCGEQSMEATPAQVVAERVSRCVRGQPVRSGPGDDSPLAARMALDIFPGDAGAAESYVGGCAKSAEHSVRHLWHAIESVAAALIERGELSGDDFRETIQHWAEAGEMGIWPYPFTDAQVTARCVS